MTADRCNYSLKISLIKSKGFSSKRRWIHVRRERERGRRRERERRSGSAYLANAEKWECLHREKSIKSHRGPRAPRNDKSYLYNATFSRRLINITVFLSQQNACVSFEYKKTARKLQCIKHTRPQQKNAPTRPSCVSKQEFTPLIWIFSLFICFGCRYEGRSADFQVLSSEVKRCKEGLSKLAAWPGVPLLFNPIHQVSKVLFWYFRRPTDSHSNKRDAADIFHHSLSASGNSWTPLTDSRGAFLPNENSLLLFFFSYYYLLPVVVQ